MDLHELRLDQPAARAGRRHARHGRVRHVPHPARARSRCPTRAVAGAAGGEQGGVSDRSRTQVTTPDALPDERLTDAALRPSGLDEFVGQAKVKESLQIAIDAAKQRREPLDHTLFFGPPGLGKTTLALLMAKELGVNVRTTSGPVLERPASPRSRAAVAGRHAWRTGSSSGCATMPRCVPAARSRPPWPARRCYDWTWTSSASTTWTGGSSRPSSSSSTAARWDSPRSPPPWARMPERWRKCTSRSSCSRGSWPARRAAAAPRRARTSISALRPHGARNSRRCLTADKCGIRNAESTPALPFRIPNSTFRILMYRTSDFDYDLPPSLIAQDPLPARAASRLLILDRASGAIRHGRFGDVVDLVAPGDALVLNVSRVIPARLHGMRDAGCGMRGAAGKAELLLVRELTDGTWLAMGHPGGKLKPGRRVTFGPDSVAEVVEALGGGLRRVRFVGALDAAAPLARYGEVPLPPYIRRAPRPEDRERYQTVYAAHDGSVAAPTAGLHFTRDLLDRLRDKAVALAELDLHVGPGTFKPVETDDLARHAMHAEPYRVSDEAAGIINERREAGGRVWAVGTTVVRPVETLPS